MKERVNLGPWALIVLAAGLMVFSGCAGGTLETDTRLNPGADIKPGLFILFFDDYDFRKVNYIPRGDRALRNGYPGEPLKNVDFGFRRGQEVLDSGQVTKIAMNIFGYILLEETGEYEFQAESNDGLSVFIGGARVLYDPDVHAARMSTGSLTVKRPGWYPFEIQFFQRKNTTRLGLYWRPPGADEMEIIPPEAFGHSRSQAERIKEAMPIRKRPRNRD
jgi:hypothetical protein